MIAIIYFVSALNALFVFIGLPIIANKLPYSDWSVVAYSISCIGIFSALDLAANSTLGRGVNLNNQDNFWENYRKHCVSVFVIIPAVGCYLLSGNVFIYSGDGHNLVFGEYTGLAFTLLIGLVFYVSQIHSCALNGLRMNMSASRSAFVGVCIRWLAPMLLTAGWRIGMFGVLAIVLISYSVELCLNFVSVRSACVKTDRACQIRARTLNAYPWSVFFKNAILLSGGAIASQVDKVYLLHKMNPSEYAIYFLMVTFVQIPLVAQYPLQRFLLPRYDQLVKAKRGLIYLFAILLIVGFAVFALSSKELFGLWQGRAVEVRHAKILLLLCIGVGMHSIFSYVQGFLISKGRYLEVAITNYCAVVFSCMAMTASDVFYAGAVSWLVVGLVQMCLGFYFASRRAVSRVA